MFNLEICRLTGNKFFKKTRRIMEELKTSNWGSWKDVTNKNVRWIPKEKGKEIVDLSIGKNLVQKSIDSGEEQIVNSVALEGVSFGDTVITLAKEDLMALSSDDNGNVNERAGTVKSPILMSNSFAALENLDVEVADFQPDSSVLNIQKGNLEGDSSSVRNSSSVKVFTSLDSAAISNDERSTPPHPDSSPDKERTSFLLAKRQEKPGNLELQSKGKRKKKIPPQTVKFSARLLNKGKGDEVYTSVSPSLDDSPLFEFFGEDMDGLLEESELRKILLKKQCLMPASLEFDSSSSAMWSIKMNYLSDDDGDDSCSE